MRKSEFLKIVSKKCGITQKDANLLLGNIFETIKEHLVEDKSVNFSGFGLFTTQIRKSSCRKIPHSGEMVDVPSRRVVKFKPSKNLKEAISQSE